MLGNALIRWFGVRVDYEVFGSVRNYDTASKLQKIAPSAKIVEGVDVMNIEKVTKVVSEIKPDIVINCVGIVKQVAAVNDPLVAITINSLLPHRLAQLTQDSNARLIHISTDCVFSGKRGNYSEKDFADADDLYGRTKLIGEVKSCNSITLRTSIIGHEVSGCRSLIDWFLSQTQTVNGYKNAIFSGLPTVEIARIIHEFVIRNPSLQGLYHVSAEPISKYDLLSLVAKTYNKKISIIPNELYKIDRSLDSTRFRSSTGFVSKSWPCMVNLMHELR